MFLSNLKFPFSCFFVSLFFLFLGFNQASAQNNTHPLDPLSWQEYWKVLEVLQKNHHLNPQTGFSEISLIPPDKSLVWNWKPGQQSPRAAYAIVHQDTLTYRAEIDLNQNKLLRYEPLTGIQPAFLGREFGEMSDAVKEHPDFIAAMKKRGYDDLSFIGVYFSPSGYYGTPEQIGKRIALGSVIDLKGVRNNWSREIDGLVPVVDIYAKKIIRIVDEEVVPVPAKNIDYDPSSLPSTREVPGAIMVSQPNGAGFSRNAYVFEWQKWKMHIRPDQRVGMIVSAVSYQDGTENRKVMYEGFLSEMFVPYMDPSFGWYPRNFMDVGEYSGGGLAKPLLRGLDAPDYALYMDGLVIQDDGRPRAIPDVIAVFERENGDPSWRHYAYEMEPESRKKRDLVIRFAAVVANYDYVFDWIFQQDGSIRVLVGATGIAEVKATNQKDASSPVQNDQAGDAYGRFVDPHIVAINHDHYFNFRLDLDIDGENNRFELDHLKTQILPEGHPRRSIWVLEPQVLKSESQARLNMHQMGGMALLWRVISQNKKNHVGYPTSYQLMPGMSAGTLLSPDDYPRRRAGFIDYDLWVTAQNSKERFAAGDFPTLSLPGKGLPEWIKGDRSIDNKDIVLWYTIGMHHLVRAEDWPVMPVLWHSFELRPFDFFSNNPAMDLPRR